MHLNVNVLKSNYGFVSTGRENIKIKYERNNSEKERKTEALICWLVHHRIKSIEDKNSECDHLCGSTNHAHLMTILQ